MLNKIEKSLFLIYTQRVRFKERFRKNDNFISNSCFDPQEGFININKNAFLLLDTARGQMKNLKLRVQII